MQDNVRKQVDLIMDAIDDAFPGEMAYWIRLYKQIAVILENTNTPAPVQSIGDRMYTVKQAALKAGGTVPSDESLLTVIERTTQHSAIADLLSMATLLDDRNQPDQSCKVILSIMQKHGVSVNSLTELMTSGFEIEQRRAQLRTLGCNAGSIALWEDRKWELAEWAVKGGTALIDLD